eukprot:TRINITY_DN3306_c0_g3_i1.p1 TRINITY_DN3306_c0_g3~~TRINITY_DN3306_c0_g3_i1.p1  ORF type:complete len:277 (-),score=70.14 TRINITY_DN3306_c0_g3_i1:70-900(-)
MPTAERVAALPPVPRDTGGSRTRTSASVSASPTAEAASCSASEAVAARASARAEEAFAAAPTCATLFRAFTLNERFLDRQRIRRAVADTARAGIFWHTFTNHAARPEAFRLSAGGSRMLHTPNAGGNSIWSEVISYEILAAAFGATLQQTETEIEYDFENAKITDYACMIDGHRIGVSVTRVINFPDLKDYKRHQTALTAAEARRLLEKKLYGVIVSSKLVARKHRWEKQILHIFTTSRAAAHEVYRQYYQMPEKLTADTVVVLTVADADYLFVNT